MIDQLSHVNGVSRRVRCQQTGVVAYVHQEHTYWIVEILTPHGERTGCALRVPTYDEAIQFVKLTFRWLRFCMRYELDV